MARASLSTPLFSSFAVFDRGEEQLQLLQRRGEYLFPAHLQFGPRGADDQLQIAAAFRRPAANARLGKHPLDARVQQNGVVDAGNIAVIPEMNRGDRRGNKLARNRRLQVLLRPSD